MSIAEVAFHGFPPVEMNMVIFAIKSNQSAFKFKTNLLKDDLMYN
ncbi:hypothetical protein AO366_1624 [Moraxella catarrhalis]|uniref:Uncharacterized protein n=1 Tax=Moraxella catarrhalis TaxID=480 RepID=A0AB36DNT2_MORCA|nr:hypothetical protein AO376_1743 [Moraxella catarrhalis]OAV19594.1 hypothetical protein AO374_0652 [Moraxella catarrhalis]OAV25318.1 hypothetical protein AO370_1068 [Moraxella catarrhalis]OAV27663.1 hypothetical protein AO368_1647 [Moraxella catarrhalis]OAV32064.1 hypothetical protein AO366_1624 [Moraxella catarrhalis]